MITYLKFHPIKSALFTGFLLAGILAIGIKISVISQKLGEIESAGGSQESTSSTLNTASTAPVDPKIHEIMQKCHVGLKAAQLIALGKMQILDQTDNSMHVSFTFPDKFTMDETATVAADPGYTPSPAELDRAAQTGSKVHGPKFTIQKNADKWTYNLQYHVPYGALPSDVRQKIQPAKGNQSSAHFFDLVPSALAQGSAQGGELTGEVAVSLFANLTVSHYEEISPGKSLGADAPLAIADAFEDAVKFNGWMNDMNKLIDCAQHPTNLLSQKASQDASYQHDVMDQLSAAKTDVESTAFPTVASDAAGVASHWLPYGSGAVAGVVFSTQDDAVEEYAKGRIAEASKYVVPCQIAIMLPGNLRPMHAVLEYAYNKTEMGIEEKRTAGGEFDLNTQMGGLEGEGPGKFAIDLKQVQQGPNACAFGYKGKADGDAKITAGGGGTPYGGVIELHLSADLNLHESGMVPDGQHCAEQSHDGIRNYNFTCRFDRLDLVHGGTFSHFQEGDGHGTCTIDLSRK
jgi:hypothetical protein